MHESRKKLTMPVKMEGVGNTVQGTLDMELDDLVATNDESVLRGHEIGSDGGVVLDDVNESGDVRRDVLDAVDLPSDGIVGVNSLGEVEVNDNISWGITTWGTGVDGRMKVLLLEDVSTSQEGTWWVGIGSTSIAQDTENVLSVHYQKPRW